MMDNKPDPVVIVRRPPGFYVYSIQTNALRLAVFTNKDSPLPSVKQICLVCHALGLQYLNVDATTVPWSLT